MSLSQPRLCVFGVLIVVVAAHANAQTRPLSPEKGRFLVAREELGDPNFFQTVVLMLDYNEKGAMGVIVNRPTPVRMSEVFPKLPELRGKTDNVFLGGPVEPDGVVFVVRHSSQPEGFHTVAGDLYTGASVEGLAAMLSSGGSLSRVRVYAGYSGWGPGQLDRELQQGSWLVTQGAPEPVFDPNPQGVWRKLIDASRLRFAGLPGGALLP